MSILNPVVAIIFVFALAACADPHHSQYPTSLGKTSPSSPMGGSGPDTRDAKPQQHDTALPIPSDPAPRESY